MGLTIVMPYSFCAIANTARFSKWMLADTTGIVYMAFLYVVLLSPHFGDITIGSLDRNRQFIAQSSH